jgi:ABC-type dipeptide/oligopeptide/nickel transport system permease component
MIRFLLRRFAFAILLVAGVASAAFLLIHLAPGQFYDEFGPNVDREQLRAEREALGLDRPFGEQYVRWLSRAARLDLGTSLKFRRPVTELVAARAMNTAMLGALALLLATGLGIPLGVAAGARRSGALAQLLRAAAMVLLSVPPLVAALALTALAARAGWLAPAGVNARNLVVPSLALALPLAAVIQQMQARALADTMREPYLRAALARGLPRRVVVWKHAFRASVAPLVGIYGVIAGTLLSGSFIVEIVTDWPGLGMLMADALRSRDLFLVAGCAAAGAAVLAVAILISDLLHAWLDPRVRET